MVLPIPTISRSASETQITTTSFPSSIPPTSSPSNSDTKFSSGAITGIALGAAALEILCLAVGYYIYRRRVGRPFRARERLTGTLDDDDCDAPSFAAHGIGQSSSSVDASLDGSVNEEKAVWSPGGYTSRVTTPKSYPMEIFVSTVVVESVDENHTGKPAVRVSDP
ncbi:hypothetical protein BKA70DRAFT_1285810, partial [Coprinopsis sp. MPI-PUGE-AT-0042]